MAKYTGTVKHNDLEGGFFELHTDGGDIYRLEGGGKVTAGTRVVIEGDIDSGGFGLQMSGPSIKVSKVSPA